MIFVLGFLIFFAVSFALSICLEDDRRIDDEDDYYSTLGY